MGVIAVVIVISRNRLLCICGTPRRAGDNPSTPAAGRSALVILHGRPFLRQEGSRTGVGIQRKSRTILLPLVEYGCSARMSWAACRWRGLLAGAISVASVLFFAAYTHKKIGGYTGDTLGAGCELAEIVPAVVGSIQ